MAAIDDVFASHAALTLAHILPALLFVLLAPLIVFRPGKHPGWIDRVFYPLGAIVGVSSYVMSLYSIGGWTERSAVLLFDTLFLISLTRACVYRSQSDPMHERRWQLRAIAILLGIATTRPVMGVFFATAPPYPSAAATILRHRLLDRLLHQRSGIRALDSLRRSSTLTRVRLAN